MTWISFHGPYDEADYAKIFSHAEIISSNHISINCYLNGENCITGPGASFGGIIFSQEIVERPKLMVLINDLLELISLIKLRFFNIQTFSLRLGPENIYPPVFFAAIRTALEVVGARSIGEITHIVNQNSWAPKSSVIRNVKKAKKEGLVLIDLDSELCFKILSEFKAKKNYAFNFTSELLAKQTRLFKNNFFYYGVTDFNGSILAAIIEARINDTVILIAWDQNEIGKKLSSVDYLLYSRIEAAFNSKAKFVDMGTISTNGRVIQEGLVKHKENYSATPYLRNTYQFNLKE